MNFFGIPVNSDTLVLAFFSILFVLVLAYWHIQQDTAFDLRTALMVDDKFSLYKVGQLLALLSSTWIIIYQTRHNQLTDWLFTGYMLAWSGANLLSKYIDSAKPKQ
jgi:hypothetical protein